ncbi:hypothetical protein [Phytohabitans rumicis]|uniref:hypothetical protein n=1 Tax=Phytohabitans rumicis TaxID=1076125 RepID=UPI0031EBBC50
MAYVAEHSSAVALALDDASDEVAAVAALRRAAREISRIPHPLEPDSPLPNWCTVLHEDGVPVFHLDMKDLPPGFPTGFPVPDGATLVLAQSARDGAWEHAAWRRTKRPFTEYADRLRAFGCEFGTVPAAEFADFVPTMCMVRYSLRRAGQVGGVSFYHDWCKPAQQPSRWFVSVVWQTHRDPARAPAEPAEFCIPPQQFTAGETVLAMREAALAMSEALASLAHCQHDPTFPLWMHRRLAPLIEGLSPDRLAAVRHACLTMTSNWTYHRMVRMRLPLAHDDAGYLYPPDVRQAIASLDPDQVIGVEALLVLRTAATVLGPLFHNLHTAELVEGAGRLVRTVEGLRTDQLTELREVCRHIVARRHAPPASP